MTSTSLATSVVCSYEEPWFELGEKLMCGVSDICTAGPGIEDSARDTSAARSPPRSAGLISDKLRVTHFSRVAPPTLYRTCWKQQSVGSDGRELDKT